MATTTETVSREQVIQLRREARAAGDEAQVRMCDRALAGSESDWRACAEAIRDAEAMA